MAGILSKSQLGTSIGILQLQLTNALNLYAASGDKATLINSLKIQAQMSNLLLNATGQVTPTWTATLNSINRL